MGQYLTTLKTEQIGRRVYRLLSPLEYKDDDGEIYTVETGYLTDYASYWLLHNIFLFVLFAIVAGYGNYAGAVHDKLYTAAILPRKKCDQILYRALRAEGIARWRAWIFYAGVRVGAARHYGT